MLRTRLWTGTLLIGLAVLLLFEHLWFAPWYPILFVCYAGGCLLAGRELLSLLPPDARPNGPLTLGFVLLAAIANWLPALGTVVSAPSGLDAWHLVGGVVVVGLVTAFLREMWLFQGPGANTARVAFTALVLVYLGVLPSFLAQLRWLDGDRSTAALALLVFVTKGNDIGAYFTGKFLTGRVLGRHKMTPRLSPQKTWQGGIGGMLASVAVAVAIDAYARVIPGGWLGAVGFGLTVGLAGVLGDLSESLIKRDSQSKDASRSLPGLGGVLDVVDSLLFAAPVAYVWFLF
jgi:phosphatidate cytidylyltransferase